MSGEASPNSPGSASGGRDPGRIETAEQFADALNRLRGARSYSDLEKAAKAAPVRNGRQPMLPRSTLSDLLSGKSVPSRDTVITFLTACGLDTDAQQPWLAALEQVATSHLRRPPGAVRVQHARPRLLGVHAAIQVGGAEGELPPYVPRDLDHNLRSAVTVAGTSGGFVLLVGGSSVGKTRALVEAVRAVLPQWWLLHPDPAEPRTVQAVAADPTARTVVWLDELQNYLNTGVLTAGTVRDLIGAGMVLVATMWPEEYVTRTAPRASGQPDPHAGDRDLLDLATVLEVPDQFSAVERAKAEILAASDGRLRLALDTRDAGITQILAAGPELILWWNQAPLRQCYGKAVITAALDARRVGAIAPVTRHLLAAAAPSYLTPVQQATAPTDWLDQALAYATTPLHGAASALAPVPAEMGRIAGYIVADYLHQHARRVRRTVALPDPVWHALIRHHHRDDTTRLADSAGRRGRLNDAIALYRIAAMDPGVGDESAAERLVGMLVEHGRVEEAIETWRGLADTGHWYDLDRLAWLLAEHGRVEEAIKIRQALADTGDWAATERLVEMLVEHGQVEEALEVLRARADTGSRYAADRLARILAGQGRADELQARADAGDWSAGKRLAELLAKQGRIEEAIENLRALADTGHESAADRLAGLLAQQGRADELQARADAGDWSAGERLVELLAKRGRIEEAIEILQSRTDAGDQYAAERLAGLLAGQGRADELRSRADAGDESAALQLTRLLIGQGRNDEAIEILQSLVDAGNWSVARWLAQLLAKRGRVEEAIEILRSPADAGDQPAAEWLAGLLVEEGRLDEAIEILQVLADAGNWSAAERLAELLAERGRVEEAIEILQSLGFDWSTAELLAELLAEQGRVEEAIEILQSLADAGDWSAADRLAGLLAEQGRADELRARADAGDRSAAQQLTRLLAWQGRVEEAVEILQSLADAGDRSAADRLAQMLAERGRIDESITILQSLSDAGNWSAAQQLIRLLAWQGRVDELIGEVAAGTPTAAAALRQINNQRSATPPSSPV